MTLGELVKWYLSLPKVKTMNSLETRRYRINHLLRILGDNFDIQKMDLNDIDDYVSTRLDEPTHMKGCKKISIATTNREIAALRCMMNLAKKRNKITENPILGVELLKERNERKRFIEYSEYLRLHAASPEYVKPLLTCAYFSAMRVREVTTLKWRNVRLDYCNPYFEPDAQNSKNGESRIIPIAPPLIALLRELKLTATTDLVFVRDGQEIRNFRGCWDSAREKTKLRDIWFHDFRGTRITLWLMSNNSYHIVAKWTGHKTVKMLERYFRPTIKHLTQVNWEELPN